MMKKKTATPLFLQALGLILATLFATWFLSGVVIFMLPPPVIDVYRVGEVYEAARTRTEVRTAEGRALIAHSRHHEVQDDDGPRSQQFKQALASRLGIDDSRITLATYRAPRWVFRPADPRRTFRPPPSKNGVHNDSGRGDGGRDGGRGGPGGRGDGDRGRFEPMLFGGFHLAIKQDDGSYLEVEPRNSFRLDNWQSRTLLVYALSALLVAPLAWLFTRRLTAPIAAFAKAAERLGRDPRAPPLTLAGSAEVNDAAEAFNNMQARLHRYVEDRTAMIGAIAHDLRTPLTRIRFRIEAAPDDVRAKLVSDIDQMDQMISAALSFVRDASQAGERARVDLLSLVESVIDEAADTGADVALIPSPAIVIEGDSLALRRLLTNLIDNAVKYGGGARASLRAQPGFAIIEIADEGPGLDGEELEQVFEPFYRHEPSRNRETGGIGLGLAVVRSVARAHGGDVTLHKRPGRGLVARVMLPA